MRRACICVVPFSYQGRSRKWSWHTSRYYSDIHPYRLRKTTKNLTRDCQNLDHNLNTYPEHKTVLFTPSRSSVVCVRVCACARACVCMYVCMHVCVCVYVCMCICMCKCVCVCICMRIYVCMYFSLTNTYFTYSCS